MKEAQVPLVSSLRDEGKRSGEKHRSVKDTVLLSAWVAGYAGVLVVFRVAGAVERLLSKTPEGS